MRSLKESRIYINGWELLYCVHERVLKEFSFLSASKAYFLICSIDKINKYCLVGKYKTDTRENMNSKVREITI
jgi:hypothetical protein